MTVQPSLRKGSKRGRFTVANLRRLIVLMSVLCAFSAAKAQVPDSSKSEINSIDSPREALEVALAFSGFEEIEPLLDAEDYGGVTLGVFQDSTIRFLAEQLWNNATWEVVIPDVNITQVKRNVPPDRRYNPRAVHICLDSASGSFIKAHYDYVGSDPDAPVPTLQDRISGEDSLNLCWAVPPIALDSALGIAPFVQGSKEVTVFLVWQLFQGKQNRIWYFMARGISKFRRPGIHSAHVIMHGETGGFIVGSG